MESPDRPRPLFIYGTLRAKPLLAWALTGDSSNTSQINHMLKPARVEKYQRFAVKQSDYPAVIASSDEADFVDGYLLQTDTLSQRKKLDDFEGEIYKITSVVVKIVGDDSQPTGETIEADMYLWDENRDLLSSEAWDLDTFINERLEDWLDLFAGLELIG